MAALPHEQCKLLIGQQCYVYYFFLLVWPPVRAFEFHQIQLVNAD